MKLQLVKKISLWSLFLFFGAFFTYLYLKPKKINLDSLSVKTFGPIPTKAANPNLDTYRDNGAYLSMSLHPSAKVFGILHDTLSVTEYSNREFLKFKANHQPKQGYAWQIGIYPMVCKMNFNGKDVPRIGVYLIPTMAKENVTIGTIKSSEIIDYIDARDGDDYIYYVEDTRRPTEIINPTRILSDLFIYDEGHLWP